MNRLNFELPERTRTAWVGRKARETWESRLAAVSRAFAHLEVETAVHGLRDAVRMTVQAEELPDVSLDMARRGLQLLPLSRVETAGSYSARAQAPRGDGNWSYMVLFHRGGKLPEQIDDRAIGRLLGYPPCCIAFYLKTWLRGGFMDTTWAMAKNHGEGDAIVLSPSPNANILGRWLGLRAVPHLPCNFQCQKTVEMGDQWISFGRESGFGQEMDDLEEFLRWPVEWNALHGIAELTWPVLKVSTTTDATAKKHVVRLMGERYPAESASGLGFPFRDALGTPDRHWYFQDNGFSSAQAQVEHHKPLLAGIQRTSPKTVLDLGCGNGALLLEALERTDHPFEPFGCDVDGNRIANARRLLPEFGDNFVECEIKGYPFSDSHSYDLIIHQPGHVGDQAFTASLARHAAWVLLYVYSDGDRSLLDLGDYGEVVAESDGRACSMKLYRTGER